MVFKIEPASRHQAYLFNEEQRSHEGLFTRGHWVDVVDNITARADGLMEVTFGYPVRASEEYYVIIRSTGCDGELSDFSSGTTRIRAREGLCFDLI